MPTLLHLGEACGTGAAFSLPLRLRIKSEEFPSKEAARAALTGSIHVAAGLEAGLGRMQQMMQQLVEMIGRKVQFTHWGRKDG